MGKLIYSMMVSVDGFVESASGSLDWTIIDEELHRFANDQARRASAWLYGRRLYELMATVWPTADQNPEITAWEAEFAEIWRTKLKFVVSTTLEEVEWNATLVRANVADEVARLKECHNELAVGGPTSRRRYLD